MNNQKTTIKFYTVFLVSVLAFFAFSKSALAATYTVCSDGCDETAIQDVFDNNDLAPGDIVEVRADTPGGSVTFNEKVTWGSNDAGDADNQVTLQGRSGDTVIIDAEDARTECIYVDGIDYITIQNITVQNGTDKNIEGNGITDGVVVQNVTSTDGVIGIWFDAGDSLLIDSCVVNQGTQYGLVFYTDGSGTNVTNSTVQNNTFNGEADHNFTVGLHFGGSDGLTFSGNEIYSWSLANSYDKLINFASIDGLTVSNNTVGSEGNGNNGYDYYFSSCSNTTVTDSTSNYSDHGAFYFDDTTATVNSSTADNFNVATGGFMITGTSNVTFNSCTASNGVRAAGTSGFYAQDSATATINNSTAHNNTEDGFGITDTATLTCNYCLAYSNGDANLASSGDGFTSHSSSVMNVKNSIAYGNYKAGVAVTGASSGLVYNSSFYNNYDDSQTIGWTSANGAGIAINATGEWIIKNNITANHEEEMVVTSDAVSGGLNLTSDYNLFYDSRGGNAFHYDGTNYSFTGYQTASSTLEINSVNQDPLFEDEANDNFILQSLSPAVDAGTDVSLTSDYAGNSIYGTPDIGAYEYQPPYTMGTNLINTTGFLRLYTDGKHRYTAATSTAPTADFTVTPINGSFYADYEEYMDITIDSWLTTGTYNKQWTATSSIATTTVYTINNLDTDTYYQFKIDGTASSTAITDDACNSNGSCLSDANGSITFTYTGGYSTHTFSLEKDVTEPSSFELSSPADGSLTGNRQPVLSWNAASDSESGISYYQLYLDGVLNVDNISGTSASLTNLSDGSHTWYVKAVDNNGNVTGSSSFNLSFGGGSGGLPSVAWLPPIIPSGGFQVSAKPAGKTVALEFSAGTDIARMAISDNPDFSGASQIPYQPSYDWEYPEGTQTVYIKFFNQWGQPTETITQAIGTQATPKLIRYPNDFKVYLIKDGKKFWIKDEQTFNSLNYNWNDVVQTTQDYPDGEAVSTAEPTVTLFSVDLTRGTVSDDVRRLQQLLSTQSDIYPEGLVTGYFGSLTESAVQRFQLKYGVVASPAEPGYGRVGPKTRKKLGEVF